MHYPVANAGDWDRLSRRSILSHLDVGIRNRRFRRRAQEWRGITIEKLSGPEAVLSMEAIVLLCAVKDGMKYLPSLLAHYRRLGVQRFAIVDDQSEDGTRDFLAAQGDVDLYRSDSSFRQSNGGLVWRDLLVGIYGRGRWYVSIDCDEYLVFPGSESRGLTDFIEDLKQAGRQRVLAAMIDIYPDGSLGSLKAAEEPETFPTEICPLYDGSGYSIAQEKFCTAVRGGPRHRLFGADMRLSKFPLLYADASLQFSGGSHHGPLPLSQNFAPVGAVLLHYKFPEGAVEEFRRIAERGTHFGGSQFYREIVSQGSFGADSDFRYEGSRRYAGSEALVREGFMQDLRRARASSTGRRVREPGSPASVGAALSMADEGRASASQEAISVLHHLPLSSRNWGGIQVQFENFLRATDNDERLRNHLTIDGRALPPGFETLAASLAAPPFDYRRWHGVTVPKALRVSLEAHRARRWKLDAVTNVNLLGDMRAIRVAEKLRAAPVYWERGASWFPRLKPVSPEFREGHALVVANSAASARMLRDVWEMTGPVEVLKPCVWDERLQAQAEARALPQDRPLKLGFAARLRSFKGGVLAVQTIAELGRRGLDAELLVAGEGPDAEAIRATATLLGVAGKIRLLGHVRDMTAFYEEIDLLLHPALREPYGNVCAEAAMAGVPSVATRVDGLPEVIEDGQTGICVTPTLALRDYPALGGDRADVYPVVFRPELDRVDEPGVPEPAALADAVLAIAGSSTAYDGFSRRAAAAAKERFSPTGHIDRFVTLMRLAIDRRR